MNSKSIKILLSVFLVAMLFISNTFAEGDGGRKGNTLNKPMGDPVRAYMNINLISTVIKNTGISDIDVFETNSGLVYPRGSGKTAVFESGLVWGAIINDPLEFDPHVGGSTYTEGLQGGWIDAAGNVIPPGDPRSRIYRVRPVVYPGGPEVDLTIEANDEGKSAAEVRLQYDTDWTEWPADLGAPYTDVDNSSSYDPNVDIPGVPGADQTIWYVANDQEPGVTQNLYGTYPMGIEMQTTMWAYAQTGALGSMFFRSYVLINKSDVLGNPRTFDSMYVSMWSDVDLGNSTDDFAGSDTTLSLVYCFNGQVNDATYSPLPPPAVGFDFFQGPIVPSIGDSAIFRGKRIHGYKNLPMTAAYYFTRGDATVTDPVLGSPDEGAVRFYRFMKGRVGLTNDPFVDPTTGQPTTFALNGNPLTGVGWVDGMLQAPGDRRIGAASGPFVMAPGDTQEVVVAEIVAGATPDINRLVAIGLLKYYDETAQTVYNNFFNVPVPPPSPQVNIPGIAGEPVNGIYYALDEKVVLDWGENQNAIDATEGYVSQGHTFQGYNIYQFPTASSTLSDAIRVATIDKNDLIKLIEDKVFDPVTGISIIKPVQFGEDSGIRRYIEISQDAINQRPLINGIRYYFAVTAYSYNPDVEAVPRTLESPPTIYTIVPQSKLPGQVFGGEFADTLEASRISGSSDGWVYPIVIDPTRFTGLSYTVSFDTLPGGTVVWNVDRSDNVRVLENQTNQNSDAESPIVDGIQFRVIGAPLDFKLFSVVSNGAGPLSVPEPGAANFAGFPTPLDGPGAGNPAAGVQQSTNSSRWIIHTADNGGRGAYDAFLSRTTRDGGNWPEIIPKDFELRFTATGGWAFDAYNGGTASFQVPFELWNIGIGTPEDPSDDYRMIPWLLDDDSSGTFNIPLPGTKGFGTDDHSASGGDNDPYTDWIYWTRPEDTSPGQSGYLAVEPLMQNQTYNGGTEHEVMARMVLVEWNGGSAPPYIADLPETGTVFRIQSTKPNVPGGDVFSFQTQSAVVDNSLAQTQVNDINVFPNPYYGINTEELNKYNRFVTFSHLPKNAKVRIFNLAGVLVKNIDKTDDGQYLRWDLANQDGLPVASGLYIAYIELPDLGTTKILKLAIIQEQQVLDRF